MANNIPIRFDIYRGDQLINTQTLEKDTIKIGSQPSVDLRLDDPGISKMHAVIERTATGFQVADLAGPGGTVVNGAAVTDRRALSNGDKLQVGPFCLVLSFSQDGRSVGAGVAGRRRKRKKKTNEFERRFLSERYTGGVGMLEVAVVWKGKIISQDQFEKSAAVVVGSNPVAKYRVEHPDIGDRFDLLTPSGNTWELNLTDSMDGFVVVYPEHNGKVKFSIRDAITHGIIKSKGKGYSLPVDGNHRVKLSIGDVTLLIHYVSRQALKLAAVRERDRSVMWWAAAGSLAIALVGTWLVGYYPDRANALTASQNLSDASFLKVIIAQKEKEKETEQEKLEDEKPEETVEEEKDIEKPKDKPNPTATNDSKVSAPSNLSPSQSKSYKKAASVGAAKSASKLQSIASLGVSGGKGAGEAVAGLAGFAGDTGSGVAGLDMASSGLSGGEGGLGSMGGGGNVGGGLEGGGGKGGDGDYRNQGGELKEKPVGKPILKPSDPNVGGGFDKQIIKRVVNQKKSEITNCYQKELQKKPDLKGKVTMKWRILSSGNVGEVSVSSNEMGNDAVGNCLKGRIAGWKFPAPKSGSAVDVSYPFNFDSK